MDFLDSGKEFHAIFPNHKTLAKEVNEKKILLWRAQHIPIGKIKQLLNWVTLYAAAKWWRR